MDTKPIMTINGQELPLNSRSGLLDTTRAVHLGLVFDMSLPSCIHYLCKEGFNSTTIALLTGGKPHFKCSDYPLIEGSDGLNYLSMHLQLHVDDKSFKGVYRCGFLMSSGPRPRCVIGSSGELMDRVPP
ncbi:hypothetical protein Ancab_031683 [Ancistrocladus abbreviatus]